MTATPRKRRAASMSEESTGFMKRPFGVSCLKSNLQPVYPTWLKNYLSKDNEYNGIIDLMVAAVNAWFR